MKILIQYLRVKKKGMAGRKCKVKNNALKQTSSFEMWWQRIYGRDCGGYKKTVLGQCERGAKIGIFKEQLSEETTGKQELGKVECTPGVRLTLKFQKRLGNGSQSPCMGKTISVNGDGGLIPHHMSEVMIKG